MNEGDRCQCGGMFHSVPDGHCSCPNGHPPCHACVNSFLEGDSCGSSEEDWGFVGSEKRVDGARWIRMNIVVAPTNHDKLTNVGTFTPENKNE